VTTPGGQLTLVDLKSADRWISSRPGQRLGR